MRVARQVDVGGVEDVVVHAAAVLVGMVVANRDDGALRQRVVVVLGDHDVGALACSELRWSPADVGESAWAAPAMPIARAADTGAARVARANFLVAVFMPTKLWAATGSRHRTKDAFVRCPYGANDADAPHTATTVERQVPGSPSSPF